MIIAMGFVAASLVISATAFYIFATEQPHYAGLPVLPIIFYVGAALVIVLAARRR
jgi:hypothetical protein